MDDEGPSTFLNSSIQIDAEFQDVVGPDLNAETSMATSKSKTAKQRGIPYNRHDNDIFNKDLDNADWEWVEETEYIVLDFGGANIDAKDMERMSEQGYSLIGLDTPTPYFQAGAHVFKGFFDENAFTEDILFDMKDIEEGMDDNDEENNGDSLDLIGIVTKRVIFEAVELLPLDDNNETLLQAQQRKAKEASLANAAKSKEKAKEKAADDERPGARKKESKMSLWKAAYDAIGVDRVPGINKKKGVRSARFPLPQAPDSSSSATASKQTMMELDIPGKVQHDDDEDDGKDDME